MSKKDQPKRIKASERTLTIMNALTELGRASATEIAEYLDLAKSTTHYHLKTLESFEYVVHENGCYRIGMKLLTIGHETVNQMELYQAGKSEIDKLARETGELCILMIEEYGYGYYIYDERGEDAVSFDTTGNQKYLHDNALGKTILAHMSSERVDEILDSRGLPVTTQQTITERAKLKEELTKVREKGIAFDREEQLEGLCCVAAPIWDYSDTGTPTVQGAISIAGPASRMTGSYFTEELASTVSDAANLIELEIREY